MTPALTACPKCTRPLMPGSRFCAGCGNDVSGVWSADPVYGGAIDVQIDPKVDTLAQMLGAATIGEYDIYGELGRGGMAAVYLGIDLSLNRKVAIKTMLPELVEREEMVVRFKREAQTAAGLNHPHIIQIYSVKQTKELVYFVMKFIEGRSLESVITERERIPLPMVQTIISQVGSALDYAHRKGVVHRDIKPANIMIDEDGWSIVTDFGIAKVQEAQNLTATGAAMGTPHYMSPEHLHNVSVTGKSDQYSLGILLFEMLTGYRPFDGRTYAEIVTKHLFEEPADVRELNADVPAAIAEVVSKMLAKEPAQRFPDIDAVSHALGAPASKQDGEIVRTQMKSLAKTGPQTKVRVSVPMSPIPIGKKSLAQAVTAAEPRPAPRAVPAPQPKPARRTAPRWIAAAVVVALLGGGGYVAWSKMNPAATNVGGAAQREQPRPVDSVPISPTVQLAGAPNTDSIRAAEAAAAAALEKQRADSLRGVRARTEQRRQDSMRIARIAENRVADSLRRADSVRRADSIRRNVVVEPPAPLVVVPQTGTIRLASNTPGAVLYINGQTEGLISTQRVVTIPSGVPVRLSINAANCKSWDTTITVAPGSSNPIGRRSPTCPQP